jgi:hypothetical protein
VKTKTEKQKNNQTQKRKTQNPTPRSLPSLQNIPPYFEVTGTRGGDCASKLGRAEYSYIQQKGEVHLSIPRLLLTSSWDYCARWLIFTKPPKESQPKPLLFLELLRLFERSLYYLSGGNHLIFANYKNNRTFLVTRYIYHLHTFVLHIGVFLSARGIGFGAFCTF